MDRVKIGFIGCGGISFKHLRHMKEIENVEIKGIFDPNKENVEKFLKEAGENVEVCENEEEVVKSGIDGVVICSPHTFHFQQMKLALENGVNVLVEKPAVVSYEEAVELKKLVEKSKKAVVVGYQRHYLPVIHGARKIIEEGKLGEINFISGYLAQNWVELIKERKGKWNWRLLPEFSGKGQLTDSGSHFVALLFFLTGLNPERVSAFIDFKGEKVDINTGFLVNFRENVIGSFAILGIDTGFREKMVIWGENGVMKISPSDNSFLVHYKGEENPVKIPEEKIEVKNPSQDLIKCITSHKKPETSLDIVEKVALLSDKIYEAFYQNSIVKV